MATKKLDKKDIDEMTDIRIQYQENNSKLGMITADEYFINTQLQQLTNAKSECFETLNKLRGNEQELIKKLEDNLFQNHEVLSSLLIFIIKY